MYKLKQKLSGTKRKVDEIDSANRKGKAKAEPEEDDDEESKSQSVTKKPRLGGTSALLAFEPNESVAKSKKKKKKDKGHLDPGSVASEEKDALPPPGHASSSTSVVISDRDASSQALAAGTAREEREGAVAERAEPQAGSVEPEALPSDVSEKKRKKKKRKTSGEEQGGKSKLRTSGGGDGDKDEDQGGWEDDGEEWLGIPPPPPPPESDMGHPPKPSKPTRAPSPDLKSTTTLDSRIYRHPPPRPTGTPTTQATNGASIPSVIPSSSRPFGSLSPSPSQNGRSGVHSHPSTSLLPTLPNGDLSSPHKKKKKRKRALLDQAQALDEQSSEATLVSSSDHTARYLLRDDDERLTETGM
ncbi:hypothetical protein FRC00_010115 [Tulasnella sp. 408]|nr:hypothetical protein FRC00_010115 [Tulasnella sp. 408]